MFRPKLLLLSLPLALLAACAGDSQFDETGGIRIVRSACPAVAVPAYTGDITLFDPPTSREARAIDVVATITNLRSSCTQTGDSIQATASFEVQARRRDAGGPREVVVPYFATVTRGGTQVVSKQVGRVALRFEAGQMRASAPSQASATISRAAATIPPDIERKITRRRKPTDPDASVDPMADPAVRAAVSRASFELLVGFQLNNDQLAYNATR